MSESNNIQQLLREGIELAREGNKAEAREKFQQVVELDDKNEKGWFWLASVVETDEERRVCLSNVLFINPNNERAQKIMAQLEAKEKQRAAEEEVIPGISRRQLMLVVGGGLAVIVLLLVGFLLITGSRNAQIAEQTRVALAAIEAATQSVLDAQASATSAMETQIAIASPTPTPSPTSSRPTLPPTFTPQASPTPPVTATPLPPPAGLSGTIAGWSGRNPSQPGFLPVGLFPVNGGGQFTRLSSEPGRNPDFNGDYSKLIYTRYYSVTADFGMEQINVSGTGAEQLGQGLALLKPQMPNYCKVGNIITFVAVPTDQRDIQFGAGETIQLAFQLYTFNFDNGQLSRLTNDRAAYTFPAFSPDCTKIAVVKNDIGGANPGTDIVLVDVASLTQTALTNDLGNFTESAPHWSPDGLQIVYSAVQVNEPGNGDIILRNADGTGTPLVPIPDELNADDVFPVFSPSGGQIAFSSNRSGYYDIYIYDLTNGALYQLTSTEDQDYPNAWAP